jgi:hypothetical protein
MQRGIFLVKCMGANDDLGKCLVLAQLSRVSTIGFALAMEIVNLVLRVANDLAAARQSIPAAAFGAADQQC